MVVVCNGQIKISENTAKIYRITQFQKHVAVATGLKNKAVMWKSTMENQFQNLEIGMPDKQLNVAKNRSLTELSLYLLPH